MQCEAKIGKNDFRLQFNALKLKGCLEKKHQVTSDKLLDSPSKLPCITL